MMQANREDHELSIELYDNLPRWITEDKIRANHVLPLKGLQSVPEGFQIHRDGKISGKKIVYEI
jgi:NADPH-dependent curcumin reductase CurA